ncbi:N-acetyltransferase [Paenarthrobacter sp. Z7-10]|uniref:GNAT family N-acetyltransferase n=1 Tax=Paenarthrobacter sp. Z7-10 TaxID=2787635 RepID=UPI0022A94A3C|nr:GNAT family N-acetyltransferase [Paenarthrobacter sp. Z7-10]MCZ2403378.1 N-acetyltransferase [Paenarthrobacter sp. Z7-10]
MIDTAESFHNDVTMHRNDVEHRYELQVAGKAACAVDFRDLPGHVDFLHTETADGFSGRGLAKVLARYALDDVVASGKRIIPHCAFIARFVSRHDVYTQCTDWPSP